MSFRAESAKRGISQAVFLGVCMSAPPNSFPTRRSWCKLCHQHKTPERIDPPPTPCLRMGESAMKRVVALLLFASFIFVASSFADTVILRDGASYSGQL